MTFFIFFFENMTSLEKANSVEIDTKQEAQNIEFVDIIDNCIRNLEKTLTPLDNQNIHYIARDVLITKIINDIRLGNTDVMVRLSALDTIFDFRKVFPDQLSDLIHIQYAYEDFSKTITDESSLNQISEKLDILKKELFFLYQEI